MPHLAPPTLTAAAQKEILRITAINVRDHSIFSVALTAGLRLAELVGLNVGGVYTPDGTLRVRVRTGRRSRRMAGRQACSRRSGSSRS